MSRDIGRAEHCQDILQRCGVLIEIIPANKVVREHTQLGAEVATLNIRRVSFAKLVRMNNRKELNFHPQRLLRQISQSLNSSTGHAYRRPAEPLSSWIGQSSSTEQYGFARPARGAPSWSENPLTAKMLARRLECRARRLQGQNCWSPQQFSQSSASPTQVDQGSLTKKHSLSRTSGSRFF
ncbi:hypothetical protein PM082_013136 [Marasmius tenuissimus]|nr:hypothetical protein PM082_013136 [Marasmius tenuissimus]